MIIKNISEFLLETEYVDKTDIFDKDLTLSSMYYTGVKLELNSPT